MLIDVLVLCCGLLALSCACLWTFQAQVGRCLSRPTPPSGFTPPVSILKPLAGLDENLEDNLRSIAEQDYPAFEVVCGLQAADDPARAVALAVQRAYPHVPIHVVVHGTEFGRNPKVNNLAGIMAHAAHEYLLVSDANVCVGRGYLRALVAECADPAVGMVSSVLMARRARSFGAGCEDLHLNTFVAPAICAAQRLGGHPCVVGKSMLLRRGDLAALGGWGAVRHILAEDYVLGQAFHHAGWKVALSAHVVEAVHERRSVRQFAARHLRWAQMRRRLSPATFLGEWLLNPTPTALAVLALGLAAGRPWAVALALGTVVAKCVGDGRVAQRLRGAPLPAWQYAAIVPKDLLVAGIWLVGCFRRRVAWRGNSMRMGAASLLLAAGDNEAALLAAIRLPGLGGRRQPPRPAGRPAPPRPRPPVAPGPQGAG